MRRRDERHRLYLSFIMTRVARKSVRFLLATALFACLAATCFADDGPKPDPSGVATGDKTSVVDAAGNPFVVADPTDKTAPDYAANKKAFDEYQAQAAKEPLAAKLADGVGHVRIATNF